MINQIIRYSPILKYLKKNKSVSILEIWSWSQWLGKFSNRKFTWLDFTTADYWKKEKKTNKKMKFVQWNCLNIPLEDNSFDFVFSLDMIEHLEKKDRKKAFEEAIRVAGKDIIIAFPCDKIAYYYDNLLYTQLKNNNSNIPWRLKEHIISWIPEFTEIQSILKDIKNITRKHERNANIWTWSLIMYLELYVRWWGFISQIISHIINFFNVSFNNKYWWYRLFIYIKKWAQNK